MTWDRHHSMLENVAAISGDFHTHSGYGEFYDIFGPKINGFPGIYAICIELAKAMTEWEAAQIRKGHAAPYDENGLDWVVIVEEFVDCFISDSLIDGHFPTHTDLLLAVTTNARPT